MSQPPPNHSLLTLLVCLLLSVSDRSLGAEAGDVKMRFVFQGPPPEQKRLTIESNATRLLGTTTVADESLLVNAEDNGVTNVVAWLLNDEGVSAAGLPSSDLAPVTVASRRIRYEPRILLVQPGQTLVLHNDEDVTQSFRVTFLKNQPFDILLKQHSAAEKTFFNPEPLPTPLVSNIYPHMRGFVFLPETKYAAVADSHGNLTLRKVPVGRHTLMYWHEKHGWKKLPKADTVGEYCGRTTIVVHEGENDLGQIKLGPTPIRSE